MSDTAIDVKKTPVGRETTADEWQSFLSKLDRLFDGFDAGFRLPRPAASSILSPSRVQRPRSVPVSRRST